MSSRITAWLAWSLCALSLALTAIGLLLLALNHSYPNAHFFDYWGVLTVGTIGSSPVGALIASRRPENPVGWILCALGLAAGVVHFAAQYAIYTLLAVPGSLPGGEALAWVSSWSWVPCAGLLVYLVLLFPDGRLRSPRWRWFGWLSAAVLAVGAVSAALLPGPIEGLGPIRNPLGIEAAKDLLRPVAGVSGAFAEGLLALVAAVSLFGRLRRSTGVERQQVKWFAYAVTVVAVSFFLTFTVAEGIDVGWVWRVASGVAVLSVVCVPVAIGIAVLRYRLHNIDILINRTLVYGSLTALLALVYFGAVAATEAIFQAFTGQGRQPQLAIVVSTLVIAALFNPLRRRVQSFIDRRFYRRKYDAAKTLEAFSAKLREETNLDRLGDELVGVVRETMQPEHVSLWLRPDTASKKDNVPG